MISVEDRFWPIAYSHELWLPKITRNHYDIKLFKGYGVSVNVIESALREPQSLHHVMRKEDDLLRKYRMTGFCGASGKGYLSTDCGTEG
jgi:hypothetical protein